MTSLSLKTIKLVIHYQHYFQRLLLITSLWHSIALLPPRTAILMLACSQHGLISILHKTQQLIDFTALTALLSAITEPYVVLHIHYASKTSTMYTSTHRCLWFVRISARKKIVAVTYTPTLVFLKCSWLFFLLLLLLHLSSLLFEYFCRGSFDWFHSRIFLNFSLVKKKVVFLSILSYEDSVKAYRSV